MIAYLLHEMPEDDRAKFSGNWMADSALHQELRDVEAELIDEYVSGNGPAERRSRVELNRTCSLRTGRRKSWNSLGR